MKKYLCKTVAMMFAIFAVTSFLACSSSNDDDDGSKEYVYYMNTTHMTLAEGAPCTLDQVAQEYQHYFDKGCDPNKYNNQVLQDIIVTTNKLQSDKGWTKFYHGYALIMCHHNSYPNENEPMFKYDFDTNTLTEIKV